MDPQRHRAKRSLGQNFLVDPNLQRKIVEALQPGPDDVVLEIGPGQGALTQHLAGRVGRLILVELDTRLVERLRERYGADPSVTVVHADILDVSLDELVPDPERLKVIGNIPYNITTPILFSLLERRPRPREILLMVQREVADRITASPGGKTYGALAVGVQTVAAVERVLNVGRQAFRPVPDVESTVVRVRPHQPAPLEEAEERALRNLTRAAFGQRRKQLQKILRDAYDLTAAEVVALVTGLGIEPRARPEELPPGRFIELAAALRRARAGPDPSPAPPPAGG
jgi:16S rRNA (adenine1518-N6/adenine1519-N6)-dimethyltransferase